MTEFLITAVPNGTDGADGAFRNLMRAGSSSTNNFGELTKVEVPTLLVGTLDGLMTLSDELAKLDQSVESVVKKIDRAAADLSPGVALQINGGTADSFVQHFTWDYAKYPHRRSLRDLVNLVTGGVGNIDEEMKSLQLALAETVSGLNEIKRKKGGSCLVADLGEIITDSLLSKLQLLDTEYLKTIFVAVPKSMKDSFVTSYEQIGADLVDYNGVKGSPVVPNSLKLVKEDFESVLFTMTILKTRYDKGGFEGSEFKPGTSVDLEEAFTKCAREKRVLVKPYVANPGQVGRSSMKMEESIAAVDSMTANMTRWCKTHYGECFGAWVHLKIIRVFVESVLRYGLPVNVTTAVFKVNAGKEKALEKSLTKQFKHLGGTDDDAEEGADEYLPYVVQSLVIE